MAYGMDARIGVNFQTAYGTSAITSMHWIEPLSESVDLSKAQLVQGGLRGLYDEGRYQEGANSVAGDVQIEAKPVQLGVLLNAALQKTATVTSGSVYTHTFKPRTSDFSASCAEAPFTYMKYIDAGSARLYSDLNANNLSLEIANGELVNASMSVVGGTFSQAAGVAASYTVQDALDWTVSSMSFGGSAKTNIRQMSIAVDNKLEAKHNMGVTNRYPSRIKRTGQRAISISGTVAFDDQTEFQQFISQTEQRLLINLRGRTEISSGYPDMLTIDAPSMRFTEMPQSVGGAGELEIQFSAMAVYNTGSANTLAITLVNCKSGY